ncbi:Transglycosylase associated protein [Weeksella virosa]|uniref:Transglycosylase-associated protein n=2 Tax=Weeksellaceae TaxID=2762318 RepID=F0NZP8_WEEVC|nr:Transglycosylase-associated protein [Weeksella virosa DSM 16922]SUP53589.1 Transglycosylase associated protein [Weeksella virosa]VEH62957.1 Transglycosylase associated protein [Weeksella virosa]
MLISTLIFGFIMNIISWAIFGLIAGVIAKMISPGKDPGGFFVTIIIGILGSILGGWIASFFFTLDESKWSFQGFLVAILGAVLLLFIYKKIAK